MTMAVSIFLASLLGSLHCAGMCGPFVSLYAGEAAKQHRPWLLHALYNLGRLFSYTILGVIAGALGRALDLTASLAGWQRISAWVAATLLVAWAVIVLRPRRFTAATPAWLRDAFKRAFRRVGGRDARRRALAIGLLSTLLPCGWLYVFAIAAAGAGDPWQGAIVMAAFWAGTVPMMLGVGVLLRTALAPFRKRQPAISAAALLVIAALMLFDRSTLTAFESPKNPVVGQHEATQSEPAATGADWRELIEREPACCNGNR